MKRIQKQREPISLTKHRPKEKADYDNYPNKDDVRKSLYEEQRGICCYCLGSISPEVGSMKIEHFQCQAKFPDKQLNYNNMLGACMGSQGQPREKQHCDTFKGDEVLMFNPARNSPVIETLIDYKNNGMMSSTHVVLNREINEVLNLNVDSLVNKRKAALDGFIASVSSYKGDFKRETIQGWIAKYSGQSDQKTLRPYCQIIVYWLQKKLNAVKV